MKRICVFCGSNAGHDPRYRAAAEALGRRLATGIGLDAALEAAGGQVAEGVVSCRSVRDLAVRHKIDMPITEAVDAILHHGEPALTAVERLLSRDPKVESA